MAARASIERGRRRLPFCGDVNVPQNTEFPWPFATGFGFGETKKWRIVEDCSSGITERKAKGRFVNFRNL